MKLCGGCNRELSFDRFNRSQTRKDGLQGRCRECQARYYQANCERQLELGRRRRRQHVELVAEVQYRSKLKGRYGLTVSEWEAMLERQGGVCAICGGVSPHGRRLDVDHCHVTGVVRGLLCWDCNLAIGKLRDSPTLARRLAEYLEADG